MPVQFIRGDLFGANGFSAIAHACDCSGSMSKGLAAQFRRRWPALFEEYRIQCQQGELRPGDVLVWNEPRLVIFNLAIQKSRKHNADPHMLRKVLRRMVALAEARHLPNVGVSRIGSGAGRLHWSEVKAVVQDLGAHTPVTLVVLEEFEPEPDAHRNFAFAPDSAIDGHGFYYPAKRRRSAYLY